jgi:hypothetical protein
LGPNILFSTLFLNNLSLCSFLNITPIQNCRQNYSFIYSNFYVLDIRREYQSFWTEW